MRLPLVLLVVGGLLTGCADETAKQNAQARAELEAILVDLNHAGRGFVPQNHEPKAANHPVMTDLDPARSQAHVDSYRQERLAEIEPKLKSLVNRGTEQNQRAARKLLADVYASQARHAARQANVDAGEAINRSTSLLTALVAAAQADSHTHLFDADESLVIRDLTASLTSAKAELDSHRRQLAAIDEQKQELNNQIKQREAARDQAMSEYQRLVSEASAATDERKYELDVASIGAQRVAESHIAQANLLKARLDAAQGEANVFDAHVQSSEQFVKSISDRLASAQQRQREIETLRSAAQQSKQQAIDALMQQFTQVTSDFKSKVDAGFASAEGLLDQSIELLEQAAQQARGEDKRVLEAEVVGKQTEKARVLADHIVALGAVGDTLAILASEAPRVLSAADAGKFTAEAKSLVDRQAALNTTAQTLVGQATEQATRLVGDGTSENQVATAGGQLAKFLQDYNARATSAKITPATNTAAPAPQQSAPAPTAPAPSATEDMGDDTDMSK